MLSPAANVAESDAAFVYAELRPNGDRYYSVTIPSLIVATYGGGTGLATQRECLEPTTSTGATARSRPTRRQEPPTALASLA